jgi:hypothetical protein
MPTNIRRFESGVQNANLQLLTSQYRHGKSFVKTILLQNQAHLVVVSLFFFHCHDFSFSGQETTHIRVGANLTCVSPALAPTGQVECRNRQIPLGFSIILIRKRKAMGRKEKVPLQWVIVESTP